MRYEFVWCNKRLFSDANTIEDMIHSLKRAADLLRALKKRGVTLDPDCCVCDGHAVLVTDDAAVADEFGFEEPEEDDDLAPHGERHVKK